MDDTDEIEHLRQEVRRLKRQIYAFVCQELERTRAKLPPSSIRTS